MYKTHSILSEPEGEALLWRYMDFVKFFDLLETEALFFPRLTILNDLFEGHPPKSVIDIYHNMIKEKESSGEESDVKAGKRSIDLLRNAREYVCGILLAQ